MSWLMSSSGRSRGVETVPLDHHADERRVPGLLLALQGKRVLQDRIGHGLGEGRHDRSGTALGVENLLPERHGAEAMQRGVIQNRPGQGLRIVFGVGLLEVPAKSIAMFLRSDFHGYALSLPRIESHRCRFVHSPQYRQRHSLTVSARALRTPSSHPFLRRFLSTRPSLIGRIVAASTRHPLIVLLLALLLTGAALVYTAQHFAMTADTVRIDLDEVEVATARTGVRGGVPATRKPNDRRGGRRNPRTGLMPPPAGLPRRCAKGPASSAACASRTAALSSIATGYCCCHWTMSRRRRKGSRRRSPCWPRSPPIPACAAS